MKKLLILAFVIIYFQMTFGARDWGHPHYSFRCTESKGIDIFGFHSNSNVRITEGNATCINKTYHITNGVLTLPYNCTNKTANRYTAKIYVFDPQFDKRIGQPIVKITGGHTGHYFSLECNEISAHGVKKTVAKVFHGGPHVLPVNNKEVSAVEMHFRATNDIDAPDISEIYIGDAFYMFFEYKGGSKYKIKPEKCEAFMGSVHPTTNDKNLQNITLWVANVGKSEECAKNEDLLESMIAKTFTNNKQAVVATMYGFKFQNSEYLTVTCEVSIFPNSVNVQLCTKTRRRRRETLRVRREMLDTPFQRKSITRNLKVNDHSTEYSNSANKIQGPFVCFMISWSAMIASVLYRESW